MGRVDTISEKSSSDMQSSNQTASKNFNSSRPAIMEEYNEDLVYMMPEKISKKKSIGQSASLGKIT